MLGQDFRTRPFVFPCLLNSQSACHQVPLVDAPRCAVAPTRLQGIYFFFVDQVTFRRHRSNASQDIQELDLLSAFRCWKGGHQEKKLIPAPSKGCLLVVFKYLKASKRHPLEGAGLGVIIKKCFLPIFSYPQGIFWVPLQSMHSLGGSRIFSSRWACQSGFGRRSLRRLEGLAAMVHVAVGLRYLFSRVPYRLFERLFKGRGTGVWPIAMFVFVWRSAFVGSRPQYSASPSFLRDETWWIWTQPAYWDIFKVINFPKGPNTF